MTNLRSVLKFNKTLGITLPKKYAEKLGLHWKGFVRVFLIDEQTIGIQKQEVDR